LFHTALYLSAFVGVCLIVAIGALGFVSTVVPAGVSLGKDVNVLSPELVPLLCFLTGALLCFLTGVAPLLTKGVVVLVVGFANFLP